MKTLSSRRRSGVFASVFGAIVASGVAAAAQESPSSKDGYWAALTADNVYVRSGPSVQSSYPFSKLGAGQVVMVLEESFGWARIRCEGPSFESSFGYVPADRRVELAGDGTSIMVHAKTDVKAPNLGSKESPDASWKPIAKLAAGDSLVVLGTVEGEREKVFKVRLPAVAEGYINLNYLRRASAAEVEAARSGPKPTATAAAPAVTAPVSAPTTPPAVATKAPANATPGAAPSAKPPVVASKSDAGAVDTTAPTAPSADDAAAIPPPVTKPVSDLQPDGSTPPAPSASDEDTVTSRPRKAEQETMSPGERNAFAARTEYADLESIWEVVKREPITTAEIGTLRERYLDLASRPGVASDIRGMAKARADQLALKMEIQERMVMLEGLRAQRDHDLDRMRSIRLAIEARSDYDAVGVLNASTVYDGTRLPVLYRLQDPAVGQTIAYVVPRDDFQLTTMLGVLVGIKGSKRYDSALRVNLITPRSVDILTQRRDSQAMPVEIVVPVTEVIIDESPTTTP